MQETLAVRSWTVPLRWLQVGSIVAPLLLSGIAGVWLWRAEYRHAEELVTRNAFLAAQFGLRVLSSQEQLLRHAEGLVAQMGPELDRERLHTHFADLVAADRYSRGLALLGPDGEVLVSDRMAEPAVNWRDRAYFERLRDEQWPLFVDRIFLQPDGEDALVVAMRRPSAEFAGVLVTAVQVDVLANFPPHPDRGRRPGGIALAPGRHAAGPSPSDVGGDHGAARPARHAGRGQPGGPALRGHGHQ